MLTRRPRGLCAAILCTLFFASADSLYAAARPAAKPVPPPRRVEAPADGIGMADIRQQSRPSDSPPPLCKAALLGSVAEVQKLLDKGASVAEVDAANGWRPLHYAAYGGSAKVAKLLIDRKASLNLGSGGVRVSPLHIATLLENHEVMQVLILAGANVNPQTNFGGTPVHFAARNLDVVGMGLLLANGGTAAVVMTDGVNAIDMANEGARRAAADNQRRVDEAAASRPLPRPRITGERCARCDGSGERSPQEIRLLTSALAERAMREGGARSYGNITLCPQCGGNGRMPTAEERQLLAQYEAAEQDRQQRILAARARSDAPIIELRDAVIRTLIAFGAEGPMTASDRKTIREDLIKMYKGDAWSPPRPPPQTHDAPPGLMPPAVVARAPATLPAAVVPPSAPPVRPPAVAAPNPPAAVARPPATPVVPPATPATPAPPATPAVAKPAVSVPGKPAVAAREITIPASVGRGNGSISVGPVKRGQTVMFQYVRGEWSAWPGEPPATPDVEPKNYNIFPVSICERSGGKVTKIGEVARGTAAKPFAFVADHDIEDLVLNMDDDKPKNNKGEVVYRVWIAPAGPVQPAPARGV